MRGIGPSLTAEESAAMIRAARSCVNVPFRHRGRNPKIGLDCSGLLIWSIEAIGRPTLDRRDYGRDPHKDGLRQQVEANLGKPITDAPRAGDVALIAFDGNGPSADGEPRHVGLLADYPYGGLMLIHTYGTIKKVTEHRLNDEWAGGIVDVYRP